MAIPKPHSIMEVGCGIGWLTILFGGFTPLAVHHLWYFRETMWLGVAAAIAWLAFLCFCCVAVFAGIREEGGFQRAATAALSSLARKHFIETEHLEHQVFIRVGYELLGRTWRRLETSKDSFVSIEWSPGQASGMTGRDCNDWHVWLWYRDSRRPRRLTGISVREETLLQIGDEGPKDKMAEFGLRVVKFLRESGIDLKPTEDPTKFTVTGELPVWIKGDSPKDSESSKQG